MASAPLNPAAARLLEVARAQIGIVENPPGSNRTKYGAAFGLNGQPWCCQFVWWCFREAGLEALIEKTAWTPGLATWFKLRGGWGTVPRVGAVVLFDFPGDGVNRISHVGIVEVANADGSIVSIEGNTSSGTSGSQRDGGGVWRRTRKAGIVGYGYPSYPPPPAPAAASVLRTGSSGDAVARLQRFLRDTFPGYAGGLVADGVFGPMTAAVVAEFQRRTGLTADGVVGPDTFRELAKYGYGG